MYEPGMFGENKMTRPQSSHLMTNGNDSAFISATYTPNAADDFSPCQSLTKREYFAAMAMQAVIQLNNLDRTTEEDAAYAVKCANALIEALNK